MHVTAVGESLKLKGRNELVSCLSSDVNEFDILIVGGGATGAGMYVCYYMDK